MAIYYVDPFKNTDGTGTFANPKGMWFSTPFTLASGDELRIIGRTLASMLTATEYTVTIRDSAVASNGGALSARSGGADADFLQHDIVYFPDYDVFMRLSAGTFSGGNYLSGTYNAVPIPVAGKLTGVRMRLVDRAVLPSFTTSACYLYSTSALANGGFTITDNWTADGVRTIDGTAKTLVTTASTIAINNYFSGAVIISESLRSTPYISADLSNSYFISGKSTSNTLNIRIVDLYNTTATIAQVYSNGTGNTAISGSSGATMYGYGNNITIKNINFYTTLISQLATNSSYKFENVVSYQNWQTTDNYSKYCNNTTIEISNTVASVFGGNGMFTFFGSQGITFRAGSIKLWDYDGSIAVLSGSGNCSVEFLSGSSITQNNKLATPSAVTSKTYALYDNSAFAQQNETYYRKPALPTGFTVTNEFGLSIPAGNTVYPLGNGKRVATRKMVLEGFSNATTDLSALTLAIGNANTTILSSDGGFSPRDLLAIQGSSQVGSISAQSLFTAAQATSTFRTVSPSLMFRLTTYTSTAWVSNHPTRKARAYKNTAIPCVAGTPITVSGWVRTSDASYISGDFSVSLVDANGDDVATEFNPTSAFINAWQQFSFTVTPTYTGELFLAFGMTSYRGGQTYWVSDMGVA